jgi:hypothetical protein
MKLAAKLPLVTVISYSPGPVLSLPPGSPPGASPPLLTPLGVGLKTVLSGVPCTIARTCPVPPFSFFPFTPALAWCVIHVLRFRVFFVTGVPTIIVVVVALFLRVIFSIARFFLPLAFVPPGFSSKLVACARSPGR